MRRSKNRPEHPLRQGPQGEGLNVYDIIRHEQLIMTVDAVKKVEEVLAS